MKASVSKARFVRMGALALGLATLTGVDCESTSESSGSGGIGSPNGSALTVQEACESWCTDESCRSIHFTQDFDACMLGCTTEQHSSPDCDPPYADYIACLADAGCVAQCTSDLIEWGSCENGEGGPGDPSGDESLTALCERGCATEGCGGLFIGSGTQCLLTCLRPGDGACEGPYKDYMQCKADSNCSAACRDEGVAFAECSQR